jgi:hypothetical protein
MGYRKAVNRRLVLMNLGTSNQSPADISAPTPGQIHTPNYTMTTMSNARTLNQDFPRSKTEWQLWLTPIIQNA